MAKITALTFRRVLNSHVEFTSEFLLRLADGSVGMGASPQGETISIYEDKRVAITPETIVRRLEADGVYGRELTQEQFDAYLQERMGVVGRNNAFSLSLAFFNALGGRGSEAGMLGKERSGLVGPRLCCNILNGGWHAYTNPVLSDFPEYLLVARSQDITEVIGAHNAIQRAVREALLSLPKTVVSGNPVSRFATADNRECIEFLLTICDRLGLGSQFELMIDASASDLWREGGYQLAITDHSVRSGEEFCAYWLELIRQYKLGFLEDPFREEDVASWRQLTGSQTECWVIGDNFYSSDAGRIEEGARRGWAHGVILKPNQAGTVTGICRAVEAAQRVRHIAIASHRSISTEETFLSTLTCRYGVPYIKIGPLLTDYSSVVRLNAILRQAA